MLINVFRNFKQELGYINATNQYIEMVHRQFIDTCPNITDQVINEKAQEVGLHLSTYNEGTSLRIARNYIVNIHSCLELFLIDFKGLKGTPAHGQEFDPKKDNRLHWTLKTIYGVIPDSVRCLYYVCDYYRQIRNIAVHSDDDSLVGNLKTAYNNACSIKKNLEHNHKCSKLNAPSAPQDLNFDDQVLFSRVARDLVERIIYDSNYQLYELISDDLDHILKMIRKFDGNQQRIRKSLSDYINHNFAVIEFDEREWEQVLGKIECALDNRIV